MHSVSQPGHHRIISTSTVYICTPHCLLYLARRMGDWLAWSYSHAYHISLHFHKRLTGWICEEQMGISRLYMISLYKPLRWKRITTYAECICKTQDESILFTSPRVSGHLRYRNESLAPRSKHLQQFQRLFFPKIEHRLTSK